MTIAEKVVREKMAVLAHRSSEARLTAQLATDITIKAKYSKLADDFDALVSEAKDILGEKPANDL